jgi:uncharacterized membrane protein YqaE (UPF0057 family)
MINVHVGICLKIILNIIIPLFCYLPQKIFHKILNHTF